MKKTIIQALLLSMLVPSLAGATRAGETVKRYRIESGIVEYALTGTQVGTETIQFDHWGAREVKRTKSDISGQGVTRKFEHLTVLDGEWMYNINMLTRIGTRMPQSMLAELLERSEAEDLVEVAENSMKELGGVKTGTEEIAGRLCDVWTIEKLHTKNWLWKGLSLKMTIEMPGVRSESVAIRIEENRAIPPESLLIPDDIKITDDPNDPNEARSGEPMVKKKPPSGTSE